APARNETGKFAMRIPRTPIPTGIVLDRKPVMLIVRSMCLAVTDPDPARHRRKFDRRLGVWERFLTRTRRQRQWQAAWAATLSVAAAVGRRAAGPLPPREGHSPMAPATPRSAPCNPGPLHHRRSAGRPAGKPSAPHWSSPVFPVTGPREEIRHRPT